MDIENYCLKTATRRNVMPAALDLVTFSKMADEVHILSHKTNPTTRISGANVAASIPSINPMTARAT